MEKDIIIRVFDRSKYLIKSIEFNSKQVSEITAFIKYYRDEHFKVKVYRLIRDYDLL